MTTSDENVCDTQPSVPPLVMPEISGGYHSQTFLGGQYGLYVERQENKTFNPVGGSHLPQKPGEFQVGCPITIYESRLINKCSRIFEALYHSNVTGNRPAAVKITGAEEHNYREARIFFRVPYHKNIVERFATDVFNFRGLPSIFIAMERCDCNLYDHVKSEIRNGTAFDPQKYTWIAYQFLLGLDFLHLQNVVHGDFKPPNVLLILDGNIAKVTDFGLSRAVTPGNPSTELSTRYGGTNGWQAPEILDGSKRISFKSDVFPCGLTLYFVWSYGQHAYGDDTVSLNHYIVKGENQDLSGMLVPFAPEAKLLLERTLQLDRNNRPTIGEVLESQFFQQYRCQPVRVHQASLPRVSDRAMAQNCQRGVPALSTGVEYEATTPKEVFALSEQLISRTNEPRQSGNPVLNVTDQHLFGSECTEVSEAPATPISEPVSRRRLASFEVIPSDPKRPRKSDTSLGPNLQTTGQKQAQESESHTPGIQIQEQLQMPQISASTSRASNPDSSKLQLAAGTAVPGTPLCHHGCDIILTSVHEYDKTYLPGLRLQIYKDEGYKGKEEFLQSDGDPQRDLQEQLFNMRVCNEGITMIIVSYWTASEEVSRALDDDNLEEFLQGKGLSGRDLQRKISDIRGSLAVFTFLPKERVCEMIKKDSAKVAVNIAVKKDGDGRLKRVAREDIVANEIIFQGERNKGVDKYTGNPDVMKFVRECLRRGNNIEYCASH